MTKTTDAAHDGTGTMPLGRPVSYRDTYAPELLFPIARQIKRDELGLSADALPFHGVDLWNAYEVSWLDQRGKPAVAIGRFEVPADSPCLVESKSLKLYLGSFRNHGAFHEDCTIDIGKRLVALFAPKWLRIGAYWYPRGGMPIDVFWQTGPAPEGVWIPDQGVAPYRGRG